MGELPFMRLWVDDLMADPDVYEMTVEEFGAYTKLLCVSWRKGSIPSDPRRIARLLKVSPRRLERLWEAVGPKWEPNENGGLVNRRQEEEREYALAAHQRRAEAGRKGGLSRGEAAR